MRVKRTTVRIDYDQDAEEPTSEMGSIVTYNRRDGVRADGEWRSSQTVHEYMRGQSVAVSVPIPRSQTDQGAAEGFAYMTRSEMLSEWAELPRAEQRAKAEQYLKAIASEWRAWADGSVFGYVVEVRTLCTLCEALDAEDVPGDCPHCEVDDSDSCWGFIAADTDDLKERMGDNLGPIAKAAMLAALDSGDYLRYPHLFAATVDGADDD